MGFREVKQITRYDHSQSWGWYLDGEDIAMTDTSIAAVVLAAGKGTRMGSDLHKVLHPLAGRPMLEHLLGSLDTLGAERRVVVVGAGRDQIAQAFPGLITAVQEPQLGTAHASAHVQQAALVDFTGIVLVNYGDSPP